MNKVKLKDIAEVQTGYSNRIQKGNIKSRILTLTSLKNNTTDIICHSFKKETMEKLLIDKHCIIIAATAGTELFGYGKDYEGALIGKGLYKIRLFSDDITVEFLMATFKNNINHLHYEGSAIKLLKINDLLNVEILIPSKDVVSKITNLEIYNQRLNNQKEKIQIYTKGILRRMNEKNI